LKIFKPSFLLIKMLTKKQILEVREHLEKAQNPIFFFDNDGDGICSFLLLQRYIGRGKGVAMKSADSGNYFKKVQELNADYIFILDKPFVSEKFFEEVRQVNLPVVWIDHHENNNIPNFVNYYNPLLNKGKTNEPVTELCYRIAEKKDDLWIAVVGCISDGTIPDFYPEFERKYPDLFIDSDKSFDIYYGSQIGKIARIFNAALKDRTTNVVNMLKFLMKAKTPYEVLEESNKNRTMHEKFNEISEKIKKLLDKARENVGTPKCVPPHFVPGIPKGHENTVSPRRLPAQDLYEARTSDEVPSVKRAPQAYPETFPSETSTGGNVNTEGRILFFQYGGELSISADLANELKYNFPNKIIVVAYVKDTKVNISIRGEKIREIALEAIKDLEGATGGGHEMAVGVRVKVKDIEKFKKRFSELVEAREDRL